jgi:hypothetical protein
MTLPSTRESRLRDRIKEAEGRFAREPIKGATLDEQTANLTKTQAIRDAEISKAHELYREWN